jgi:hypothetical protein
MNDLRGPLLVARAMLKFRHADQGKVHLRFFRLHCEFMFCQKYFRQKHERYVSFIHRSCVNAEGAPPATRVSRELRVAAPVVQTVPTYPSN